MNKPFDNFPKSTSAFVPFGRPQAELSKLRKIDVFEYRGLNFWVITGKIEVATR